MLVHSSNLKNECNLRLNAFTFFRFHSVDPKPRDESRIQFIAWTAVALGIYLRILNANCSVDNNLVRCYAGRSSILRTRLALLAFPCELLQIRTFESLCRESLAGNCLRLDLPFPLLRCWAIQAGSNPTPQRRPKRSPVRPTWWAFQKRESSCSSTLDGDSRLVTARIPPR